MMTAFDPRTAATTATFSPPITIQKSSWNSPIPYLFGGLAAMLGLMAFALLILACSYWKLSAHFDHHNTDENDNDNNRRDLEAAGEEKTDGNSKGVTLQVVEDSFLVIMAGDFKPTFLATPKLNRGDCSLGNGKVNCFEKEMEDNDDGRAEKPRDMMICDDQPSTRAENRENHGG